MPIPIPKPRPSQQPSKKAKDKTAKTPANATTTSTAMNETKKGGRHPDDESFFDLFRDLCKYMGHQGTIKVP
jgi:hypothetical protein